MECSQETLLFLPCWYTLSEGQLSDLLRTIENGSQIVAVMVSISDDSKLNSYNNSRITRNIIAKQAVIDLLTLHQVTQLPFSIVVPIKISCNNDGTDTAANKSDCSESATENSIVHRVILNDVEDRKATDVFATAVEAYDNFEFESAATAFYTAILIDPSYKSALFNFAGLLHMVGYPTLAVHFMEQFLLLEKDDMIAHSFLWALTQLKETSSIGDYFYSCDIQYDMIYVLLLFN